MRARDPVRERESERENVCDSKKEREREIKIE